MDAFAEELERQDYGNKHITLYDIRAELNHRYKDLRVPYEPPSAEEIFNMVTKESPKTFNIGKLVMATVTGFSHRKPQREQLDLANPVRNEETGLWKCPFCSQVPALLQLVDCTSFRAIFRDYTKPNLTRVELLNPSSPS